MIAGLVFIVIGIAAWVLAAKLSAGTLMMIGSGFLPKGLAVLLVIFGGVILVGGLRREAEKIEFGPLRPAFVVTLCIAVFTLGLERIGLVPTVFLVVGLSALAGQKVRPLTLALVAAGLAALCVVVFIWGAKLPIKAGPF